MSKKGFVVILTAFAIGFYIAIIMYALFSVIHIETLPNYATSMFFELISFFILSFLILGNLIRKTIKIGYYVPLLLVTLMYIIVLDVINMVLITMIPNSYCVLVNLIILFIYCVIAIPMYILGKN